MITLLFWIAACIILLFGLVVFVGAPYLPTLNPNIEAAFQLLELKQGQTLLELGSGDGRILRAAAKKGIRAVGYELNPLLVVYSRISLWHYRKITKVYWGNYWHAKWPKTDAIYVFLLQKYMRKLDKKIVRTYSGHSVKLVSLAFTVPNKKPTKNVKGLYLYTYS